MEDIHRLQRKLDEAAGVSSSADQQAADQETAALKAELKELQDMVKQMAAGKDADSVEGPADLEAELAKLKESIAEKIARDEQEQKAKAAAAAAAELAKEEAAHHVPAPSDGDSSGKGFEVNTEMPYGELEPFGREDTAT